MDKFIILVFFVMAILIGSECLVVSIPMAVSSATLFVLTLIYEV